MLKVLQEAYMVRERARPITIAIVALLVALAGSYALRGQVQRSPETQLINEVATAMGGRQRLLGVRTLVIEGRNRVSNLAAMMTPDGPVLGTDDRFRTTFDLANSRMRHWESKRFLLPARFDQNAFGPFTEAGNARLVTGVDGDIVFTAPVAGSMMGSWSDSNPDGLTSIGSTWGIGTPGRPETMETWPTNYPAGPPPPQRVFGPAAAVRRKAMFEHPLIMVRAILNGAQVSNLRSDQNWQIVDIATPKQDRFTLAIDKTTRLPAWLSWMQGDNYWGDVLIRTTFSAYETVDGVKLPRHLTTTFGPLFQSETEVSWNTVDADVGDLAAPAEVMNAMPPATQPVPLLVEEVPGVSGVWKITPQQGDLPPDQRPDNSGTCLMELSDHMVMFDVPGGDPFLQAVIAKAKELRPDKPITQLILSHFDPGHTAGLRGGVAAGMELIAHKGNVAAFTALVGKKHAINPDELAKHPQPLRITAVDDSYVIGDSLREIRIYHKIGDAESATMVIAYLPRDRVLVNSDAWSVITQQTPNDSDSPSMYDNIMKRHLQVEWHVPLHSIGIPTQAEFMKQLEYTRTLEYQFFRLAQRLRVDNDF